MVPPRADVHAQHLAGLPTHDRSVGKKQLHAGHPLGAAVHRAGCTVIQRDANPIGADDARQALTGDGKFFRAGEFCRPDAELGIK
ncbi:DUF6233 domain-containing protein [Streptomyces sp. NPDC048362]|uniref:DUF6233 domain-containing protein n=1 Tax=Streptomyces sp. NPDC048362 TaxID=3365539 RepID=UPI0037242761